MSLDRRWLLVGGVAAVAVATIYYSRCWLWAARCPQRRPRRRAVTADGGCSAAVLLFGLPASGRGALLIRVLLSHADTLAVPRLVTDAPLCTRTDPEASLYEYVTSEELRAQLEWGRFVEVRQQGGYLYGSPLDCPGGGSRSPAPLCVLKVSLESLSHLQRRGYGEPGCRPLLVYVRVPERKRHVARLMLRDWLPREAAEAVLEGAEQQLKAILAGEKLEELFDVVIDNDDLDRASDALDRVMDAQLEAGNRMFSAQQHLSPTKRPAPPTQRL